jgi:hypothetical protein
MAELVVVGLLAIGVTSFVFDFVVGPFGGIITALVATLIVMLLWVVLPRIGRDD